MKNFDSRVFLTAVKREAGEVKSLTFSLAELRELLKKQGDEFTRQAYRVYLGRDVDPAGLTAYRERAKSLSGRLFILAALVLSPERVVLPMALRSLLKKSGLLVKHVFEK